MQRSSRKRSARISQTVFRGNRCLYSFEVFPLTAKEIPDGAGVFIISRRRVDKFGSGHHNAVCIGETNSIAIEIKRHRRAKCVKQSAANVVCFLNEERPEHRAALIDDLVSARSFACVRNEIRNVIKPFPAIVEFRRERTRRRVAPSEAEAEAESIRRVKDRKNAKKRTAERSKKVSAKNVVTKLERNARSPRKKVVSKPNKKRAVPKKRAA